MKYFFYADRQVVSFRLRLCSPCRKKPSSLVPMKAQSKTAIKRSATGNSELASAENFERPNAWSLPRNKHSYPSIPDASIPGSIPRFAHTHDGRCFSALGE